MTTTQTPQAFMFIGDTLTFSQTYTNGASPPAAINLTGYTITILIRDAADLTTLATLTIGSGITLADQSIQSNWGIFTARYANTSTWAGNVQVQYQFVDTLGNITTYPVVVIGMQAAL